MKTVPRSIRKRPPRAWAAIVVVASSHFQLAHADTIGTRNWRFLWANDVVMHSDNQFTNGFAFQRHSASFSSLNETTGTLALGKRFASRFLPTSTDLYYREGWAVGQNFQTPESLELDRFIPDDVPYAGMLAWTNSYVAFNDRRLSGFEWLIGYMGPGALAEQTQRTFHKWLGARDPQGWDYQLNGEVLINFYFARRAKIWQRSKFDGALGFDAALGNFFTFGQGTLEMRFGDIPEGFAYAPSPIGRGLSTNGQLIERSTNRVYGSVILRATRFLLALPRQGNNFGSDNYWTNNNTIRMEKRVGQMIFGLHVDRGEWAYHLSLWVSTDTIDRATLHDGEDPGNDFAVFTLERRIG